MKLLIILHHRFNLWSAPTWFAERLRREFANVEVVQFSDYSEAEQHIEDADAIVTWSLRVEQVQKAKKLRWIHSPSAAVHQFILPEILNSSIILTNASSVHAPVVAEHAISLILALAKNLPSAVRYQRQHIWCQQQLWDERPHPREIADATLGIVGLGSIGTEIAVRALCLGMRILATRQHPERGVPETLQRVAEVSVSRFDKGLDDFRSKASTIMVLGPSDFDMLLSESDYIVLCAPLLPTTEALINADTIRKMRPDACVINVGRGPLVDESAIAEALVHRKIGGAALDVFESEPLPADSPLWDIPSVLITPHSAALTDKLWQRHYELLSDNLHRFLAGKPLVGGVDLSRGY